MKKRKFNRKSVLLQALVHLDYTADFINDRLQYIHHSDELIVQEYVKSMTLVCLLYEINYNVVSHPSNLKLIDMNHEVKEYIGLIRKELNIHE